jgi:hypothetical protein
MMAVTFVYDKNYQPAAPVVSVVIRLAKELALPALVGIHWAEYGKISHNIVLMFLENTIDIIRI